MAPGRSIGASSGRWDGERLRRSDELGWEELSMPAGRTRRGSTIQRGCRRITSIRLTAPVETSSPPTTSARPSYAPFAGPEGPRASSPS